MVEGLHEEQSNEERRPERKGSGAAGKGRPEGTGWAALPGLRVCLSQQPVWLRSQSGARLGMVCLIGRCKGSGATGRLLGSQSGCRPRELTRLGEQGPWEGPSSNRREGALGL